MCPVCKTEFRDEFADAIIQKMETSFIRVTEPERVEESNRQEVVHATKEIQPSDSPCPDQALKIPGESKELQSLSPRIKDAQNSLD